MRVLVVGHGSMVGEAVRTKLAGRAEVVTAGRCGADIPFDAASGAIPGAGRQCDAALLCAASFGGDDPPGMMENITVNVRGALLSALLAEQRGCRHLVYLSSLFAIDHPDNQYHGSYGITKRQGGENIELFCRRRGLALTTILPTQLYDSEGRARRHQGLFYRIVDRARQGEEILIHGTRDPLRNFLHVDDLAEVIVRVVERGITGTFPCLHPLSYRVSEICRIAFETFGTRGEVRFVETESDIPTVYLPDDQRLYELTGYLPRIDLATGMAGIREAHP